MILLRTLLNQDMTELASAKQHDQQSKYRFSVLLKDTLARKMLDNTECYINAT